MGKIFFQAEGLNKAYRPYVRDCHRYQIFFGGAGSGKSVFLATRCVLDVLQGRNILVIRKVARTLRASCWNEVIKAAGRMRLMGMLHVSKAEYTLTAKNNGAQIMFAGLDDVEKIKSITPQKGALTDVWMEEATECAWEDFKPLDKRLRGRSRHVKRFTFSFNPISREHWIYKEFFGIFSDGENAASNDSVTILKTTYKDNRFLSEDDVKALESEKDPYYLKVYTKGEWGGGEDVIFRNWRVEKLTGEENGESRMGLDFGFAGDPCGFLKLRYDRKARKIYVFEEMYEKGLTNLLLAQRLRDIAKEGMVICDSAEPKSIAELRTLGVFALPARKGPDSVLHGVQWLRQQEIVIDVSCVHLRAELSAYRWQKDKSGSSLPRPEDKNNHLIDAMRYALEGDSDGRIIRTGSKRELGL